MANDWFAGDFGPTEADLLSHLADYAEPELAAKLRAYDSKFRQWPWLPTLCIETGPFASDEEHLREVPR